MIETAGSIGCRAVQLFAKNQRRWESKALESDAIVEFKKNAEKSEIEYYIVHASYLLNLASPDMLLRNRSIANLLDDVLRCEELGIEDVVMHPGSHLGEGEAVGIKRISEALNIILNKTKKCSILIETTAGQGTNIGYKFEHMRDIISQINIKERVMVCYDTAHTFAAGYDIRDALSFDKTFDEFDRVIGLSKLKTFHVNDSKVEYLSKKDRHEFIGKGFIGLQAFKLLVNDKRFKKHPMILEVPGDLKEYKRDIKLLSGLMEK